jgi:hypothetical protein
MVTISTTFGWVWEHRSAGGVVVEFLEGFFGLSGGTVKGRTVKSTYKSYRLGTAKHVDIDLSRRAGWEVVGCITAVYYDNSMANRVVFEPKIVNNGLRNEFAGTPNRIGVRPDATHVREWPIA